MTHFKHATALYENNTLPALLLLCIRIAHLQ